MKKFFFQVMRLETYEVEAASLQAAGAQANAWVANQKLGPTEIPGLVQSIHPKYRLLAVAPATEPHAPPLKAA